jgi:coiled-coil domain-containing protein 61
LLELIDIEEITLKAGNFKKFPTFYKMLLSALSRDNENLFVDLLTSTDLDILKARKQGGSSSSAEAVQGKQRPSPGDKQRKGRRYCILTYTGEFDRVHYPLPLSYEEVPNVEALRRTIRRLRDAAAAADTTRDRLRGSADLSHENDIDR